jgi:hypothetical protein
MRHTVGYIEENVHLDPPGMGRNLHGRKMMLRNADVAADMGLAGKPPNPGVLRGMIKVSARFARRTPRFDQEDP